MVEPCRSSMDERRRGWTRSRHGRIVGPHIPHTVLTRPLVLREESMVCPYVERVPPVAEGVPEHTVERGAAPEVGVEVEGEWRRLWMEVVHHEVVLAGTAVDFKKYGNLVVDAHRPQRLLGPGVNKLSIYFVKNKNHCCENREDRTQKTVRVHRHGCEMDSIFLSFM